MSPAGSDVIVLCGVHFMAETARVLSPEKTVLIPDLEAGCSLASSITGADVRRTDVEVILWNGRCEVHERFRPESAPAVAASGVDLLSVGWITHSAPSLDVSLEVTPDPG